MSAVLSSCGQYRYRLERGEFLRDLLSAHEHMDKTIAFFGINPSTADADVDDATVRKWIGFCRRWGAKRFIVGNVFPHRATDVRWLATAPMLIGPLMDNLRHLNQIMNEADILVPCWGRRDKVPKHLRPHIDDAVAMLQASGKPVMAFGFATTGDPLHPLMLGYDTKLVRFEAAAR